MINPGPTAAARTATPRVRRRAGPGGVYPASHVHNASSRKAPVLILVRAMAAPSAAMAAAVAG